MPLALGLAAVGEGDDEVEALAQKPVELLLGFRQAPSRERGPLGVERERLPLRERVEHGCAVERERGETLLLPDLPHLVGLPDEVGAAVERQHQVLRDLVFECELDELPAALGGGEDRRLLDVSQRPLGKGREGADLLDLVAEELDPERLAAGRREDVDEPATHRELAALLDAFDPLVAGERQRLGERLEPGLLATSERKRRRAHVRGGIRLGQRDRRRADEPAAGEHLQGARPLADEVRRRLEPGAPVDAAGREERDLVLAQEPRRGLGGVPGVGVVREERDEPAPELDVQSGEEQRQRRLGDAGACRKGIGERGQARIRAQALDESEENGTVHEKRRNCRSGAVIVVAALLLGKY